MYGNKKRMVTVIIALIVLVYILLISITSFASYGCILEEGFELICQNDNLALYANTSTAEVAVINKETGFVWRSNPRGRAQDKLASGIIKMELNAQLIVKYIDTKRAEFKVNNYVGSIKPETFDFEKTNNSIKFTFNFKKQGFVIPVKYSIDQDSMTVEIDQSEIAEGEKFKIVSIVLLPYFGAGSIKDNGYIFVPDGPGAIIQFNNGKLTSDSFKKRVYGFDTSINRYVALNTTKDVYLPVYGIKNRNDAFLAIIENGSSQSIINADIAGKNSSYNSVCAELLLRDREEYTLNRANFQSQTIMWYSNIQDFDKFKIRYYLLEGEQSNYCGMAKKYQDYLVTFKGLKKANTAIENPFYIELIGGIRKKQNIFGIPLVSTYGVTKFNDAIDILESIKQKGIDNVVLRFSYWENDSIRGEIPVKAVIDRKLGDEKDLDRLIEYCKNNGVELYPDIDFINFDEGGNGFNVRSHAARSITNVTSKNYKYHLGTEERLRSERPWYKISLRNIGDIVDRFLRNYNKCGLGTISLKSIGTELYTDFRRNGNISREEGKEYLVSAFQRINNNISKIMVEEANDYIIPYVDHIINLPLDSSNISVVDYTVPFYQMVIRGYIPYTGVPVNLSEEIDLMYLRLIEYGAYPYYVWINGDPSLLMESDFNHIISPNWEYWIDKAAEKYIELAPFYSAISGQEMTNHERLQEGVYCSEFAGGIKVVVNYTDYSTIAYGHIVRPKDYTIIQDGKILK